MILCFSGGIDSYVAWHYLSKPQTVYFNTRCRYSSQEIKVVKKLIPTTIINESLILKDYEYGENAYIPFRNLLFACQAVKYSNKIVIAGLEDDNISDKNQRIFEEFSLMLSKLEGREIEIMSPFWNMTKEEVVNWYTISTGKKDLTETISCYSNNSQYCGRCPSCFRKWVALRTNGYKIDFYNGSLMQQYYDAADQNKYVESRNIAIVREINAYRS